MDKLFFGCQRDRLVYFTCKVNCESPDYFGGLDFDKKDKNKQTTLLLYYIKDESGESLVFLLKQTKGGKEIVKFGLEQVINLMCADIDKGRITFFAVDENKVPKKGERLPKDAMGRCLKIFINDASPDSLKKMVQCMNDHNNKSKAKHQENKENKEVRSNSQKKIMKKPMKNVNLSDSLTKINRKRKLKALMSGDPKKLANHFRAEKKLFQKHAPVKSKNEEEEKVRIQNHKLRSYH